MALSLVNNNRKLLQLHFNSDEASVASSQSASSSVVTSSPADAASRRHGLSVPKEHDYIGLSEVSSAPSSSPGKLHSDNNYAFDDTDLSLGLGLGTSLSQTQKAAASAQNGVANESTEPASDALSSSASRKRIHHRSVVPMSLDVGRSNMKPNSAESMDHGSAVSSTADVRQNLKFSHISGVQGESCSINPTGKNTYWNSMQNPKLQSHGIQYTVGNPPSKNNSQLRSMTNEGNLCDEAHPRKERVVGWPPVRSYRRSALTSCSRPEGDGQSTIYVKVNMDGIPIGRKIDLNAFNSYEGLLSALEGMFMNPTCGQGVRLLSGSDFILTYEDKEGDWMLVGDVPWEMFVSTVRRLRIIRGSDASSFGSRT